MNENFLSVRELQESDIVLITQYWLGADPAFLQGMGADLSKMPSEEGWRKMLMEQLAQSIEEKKSYCIIWLIDGVAVGHSNANKIIFGEEAYMHLHLWKPLARQKGYGTALVRKTLPYFFHNLQLKKLFCEPYALNDAPNRTLEKVGFTFIKEYRVTPGWINFEQDVKRWELSREKFEELQIS